MRQTLESLDTTTTDKGKTYWHLHLVETPKGIGFVSRRWSIATRGVQDFLLIKNSAFAIVVLSWILAAAGSDGFGVVTPAAAQPTALTKEQAAAVAAYDKALREFKAVLAERRAQIDAKQTLPDRPGQALYLARRR